MEHFKDRHFKLYQFNIALFVFEIEKTHPKGEINTIKVYSENDMTISNRSRLGKCSVGTLSYNLQWRVRDFPKGVTPTRTGDANI